MLLNKINGYKNISQGGIQNKQNKALQNRNEKKKNQVLHGVLWAYGTDSKPISS